MRVVVNVEIRVLIVVIVRVVVNVVIRVLIVVIVRVVNTMFIQTSQPEASWQD